MAVKTELAKMREYSARLNRIIVLLFNIMIKGQFYCRKAGDDLYFAIFLPDTRNYACCVRTTNIECAMTIFGQCNNVLNNNTK